MDSTRGGTGEKQNAAYLSNLGSGIIDYDVRAWRDAHGRPCRWPVVAKHVCVRSLRLRLAPGLGRQAWLLAPARGWLLLELVGLLRGVHAGLLPLVLCGGLLAPGCWVGACLLRLEGYRLLLALLGTPAAPLGGAGAGVAPRAGRLLLRLLLAPATAGLRSRGSVGKPAIGTELATAGLEVPAGLLVVVALPAAANIAQARAHVHGRIQLGRVSARSSKGGKGGRGRGRQGERAAGVGLGQQLCTALALPGEKGRTDGSRMQRQREARRTFCFGWVTNACCC